MSDRLDEPREDERCMLICPVDMARKSVERSLYQHGRVHSNPQDMTGQLLSIKAARGQSGAFRGGQI
jgi:hypothetical protein